MKTCIIDVAKHIVLSCLLVFVALQPVHAGDKITYYHNDALGSPVAATNQLGQVIWRETYKPHGQRTTNATASANNKVWFTGKQEEAALGINYFGARWYHPEIGRFLVIDPAGVAPDNIHSFNRYAYANNNPYKYVDQDGRNPLLLIAVGAGALLATNNAQAPTSSGDIHPMVDAKTTEAVIAAATLAGGLRSLVGREAGGAASDVGGVGRELTAQQQKAIGSLEKQIAKHEQKLQDFKNNPTVRPGMENLPSEVIQKQQQSRIQHLETEINTFKNNIDKIKRGKADS